ncbi:hypothetical protein JYU34_004935 [Plutella xylostella]|uniref:Core-binding (CB) domain-containing protein n=1 Tax=Plutella xylostella TaxID=51655 RepID=A0ABQ7QVI4_PLUXY|nr:hypothetical protein JYU34_004935 [Plutella xylostella]
MVKDGRTTNRSKNTIRIQNTFSEKAAACKIIGQTQIVRDSKFRRNDERDSENATQRCNSPQQSRNWIPVNNVSQEKIGWNEQANLQFKKVKSVCSCPSIQTPESSSNTYSSGSRHIHDQDRYLASILSRTDSTNALQILVSSLRRRNLRNVMFGKCPLCFRKNNKLAGALAETHRRCKGGSLSRRFFDSSSKPRCLEKASEICSKKTRRIRMDGQQEKIITGAISESRISRNSLEHQIESENAFRCKSKTNRVINPVISKEKTLELARCKDPTRKVKLRVVRCSPRKTSLSLVTNRVEQTEKIRTSQTMPDDRRGSHRARLVDGKYTQKYCYPSCQSNDVYNHRRCRCRLGCDSKQPEIMGKVDKNPTTLALQSKAMGCIRKSEISGCQNTEHNYNMANRQSNCSRLHNKAGRHEVEKAFEDSNEHPAPMRRTQLSPDSALHPRIIQRLSRQSLKNKIPARVALEATNSGSDISASGHPRDRFICFKSVCSSDQLCKRGRIRHGEQIHGRLQPNLALRPRLRLPPAGIDTESSPSPRRVDGDLSPSNSRVAQSILDAGNQETGNPTAVEDPRSDLQSHRSSDESSTSGNRQPQFAGLDNTGWANEILNWNSNELELLQASWRKSTLKTYRPAWERWRNWATDNNVKIDDPKPSDLARFLCYLHDVVKLAPKTIYLHKSVVATFTNPHKSSVLSSHPIISHVLKGILSKKPTVRKPLSWKIDDLLRFLEKYNIDNESLFSVSRHTCILLLLASSRRIHDLTLLSIGSEDFEEKGDELIFWPKFGSKTDSHTFRQSGWCLKSHPEIRFDIIHWIGRVITLSLSRRQSRQLLSLFITTRGVVKAASRAVIAGWVKSLFKEANITSSAGSIRAAVATYNWSQKNLDIDEVLKRGNWRSKNTFFNHYFREIQPVTSSRISDPTDSFVPID